MTTIRATNSALKVVSKDKPLDASFNSQVVAFRDSKIGSIQVVRSNGDVNDGVFSLEVSNLCEEDTFAPYPLSEVSSCVDNNIIWLFDKIPFLFARLIYTKGTDTVGTANIYAIGKQ